MILEIDNVELWFKDKRILHGIYLKAKKGEVTGILGSNGSGKSCLLKIIFGHLTPKYKLIRIDNKPITKAFYKTKLVAYLPQQHFFPKNLKIKKLFKFLKVDWQEFSSLFSGFSKYHNSKINKLSGGEQRVIETYLVLKGPHKIVLLDEPFSHLSPHYIECFINLINTIKSSKIIILTDHIYQHIINISDKLYLLENGYSREINDLEDLKFYKYVSENTIL
ncbi:ATP-binding cassette domain-containing protein [Corallibacter vietnamensis]|uniref:ATP-binding cassette domain-containing protein n=2 Tax=Corallibacter TaxID=1511643 RepID=A0ABP7H1U5_9FLAO